MTDRDAHALLERKYRYACGERAALHAQVERLSHELNTVNAHRRRDAVALAKSRRDIDALGAKIAELVAERRTLKDALRREIDDHAASLAVLRSTGYYVKRNAARRALKDDAP